MKITIDNKEIEAKEGQTILQAATDAGVYIPNLCYHPDLPPIGSCRLCIVKVDKMRGYPTSCTVTVKDGMVVHNDIPEVQDLRKNTLWLIMSEFPTDSLDKSTQLAKVADWIGAKDLLPGYVRVSRELPIVTNEALFDRDFNKCILCGRCVKICQDVRKTGVVGLVGRGIGTTVDTGYHNQPLDESGCKFCRACVEVCPSGALTDKKSFKEEEKEAVLIPCKEACPGHINIPLYVRLTSEKRFQEAVEVIREKAPFPYTLGCICDHPCEGECFRGDINDPIAIRSIKKFVASKDDGSWRKKIPMLPKTGKKVAVIGAGPAGLTAAWFLNKNGHDVTVFEMYKEAGGMMRTGIPRYRLPASVLDREIKDIEDFGVKIKTNTRIESVDKLFDEGFETVFLGVGAPKGMTMRLPGEDDPKVLDGISMLRGINFKENPDIKGHVAVVGGGNVAMDVARTSVRLKDVKKVTVLYRRTREEMPANVEEIEEALEEGAEINFLTAPKKIVVNGEKLNLECIKMKLGEPDASGRRRPVPIEGSDFVIEVDRLVSAIGQKNMIPDGFGIDLNKWGDIAVDEESMATSRKGVFSGGDVVTGPASVIKAISAGRKAAIAMDKYLGGKGDIAQNLAVVEEEDICIGREEVFAARKREHPALLDAKERIKDFSEVEACFEEKAVVCEAERCLKCQLRLGIAKAPFPPEKN